MTTATTYPAEVLAQDLADARHRCACARNRYETAKSRKDRQFAAEDVEFYGNKAAFLAAWLARQPAVQVA
jgi:hypothetical protein